MFLYMCLALIYLVYVNFRISSKTTTESIANNPNVQEQSDLERYGNLPIDELEAAVERELVGERLPKRPRPPKIQIISE